MVRIKRIIITVFILLVASGCQKEEIKQAAKTIIPVKVFKVEFKDLEETIDYIGNIRAQEEAVIYPKVNGKIIEKIKEDGSIVNKGDVVAYIDRDEVGFKFEKAPVESPLSGIIGRVYVDIGENVTIQTPIALVVDMRRVKIQLDIPEKYYSKIALGQTAKVKVDAYPDEEFTGLVTKISPVVDLSTRASPIEIAIDNPESKLCSGMFSKVSLILAEHKNVAVILKEAIMGKEPNSYVYVIENQKAVLRNITVGIRQGSYYEIRDGLRQGDLVVIMGQQKLYDGAQVIAEGDNG
ncbi:MAG: efflux RND transporter periplasmic adaptor subunit [Candidatus Omnitrophica bacterium]|nr:efflux RND transporter periplasmic adaptor subunit [Candidatus Omnitrophota bacterium]